MNVNNIDPIRVKQKLKESDCDLCKEALECIKAYERVYDMQYETNQKAIRKIKELSRKVNDK